MVHGVRKGVVRGVKCPQGKGMSFTSWDAAEAARIRLGAERVYPCTGCGYLHITRYTVAENNERLIRFSAAEECTSVEECGTVVSSATEVNDEGPDPEPGTCEGGSGAQAVQRRPSSRSAPTPATVAFFATLRRSSRLEG